MSVHRDRDRRGHWIVRWREDGRHRSKRGFSSEDAANEFDALMRRRSRLGAHGRPDPSAMRLETWLEDWWVRYSPGFRRSTQLSATPILRKWIVPYIGRVRLRDLGAPRIRAWRAQILADGCSNNRANATMRVLSTALTAAVRELLIPTNPIIGEHRIKKLPHRVERPRALRPVEIEAIRLQLPGRRDRLIVSLVAYAGLRPEEAVALRWSAVGENALTIDEAYTAGEVSETKSGGRRSVPILPQLAGELVAWREAYEDETGSQPVADQVVTPPGRSSDDRHINWGWWRDRVWKPARTAAVVDARGTKVRYCRPYDLRHSYASLLIHEGRPVNVVAAWMGHADPSTTLKHYAHLFDEAQLGASLPMTEAITMAREALYKSKRSRFVPGPDEDEGWWETWLSLYWPGFQAEADDGARTRDLKLGNLLKDVPTSPQLSQHAGDTTEEDSDDDPEHLGPSGTPNVPEMFPDTAAGKRSRDLAAAARSMRAIGLPYPIDGAPDHTVENHERMAAGELVHPDVAFGGPFTLGKNEGTQVDEERPGRCDDARIGGESGAAPSAPASASRESTPTAGREDPDRPARADQPGTPPNPGVARTVGQGQGDTTGRRRPAHPGPGRDPRASDPARPPARRGTHPPRAADGPRGSTDDTSTRAPSVHAHENNRRWWRTAAQLEQRKRGV